MDQNDDKIVRNEEYIEIDLREYIKKLWDNKWIIIIIVILAVLTAGFYSQYIVEPVYEARATLLILPSTYKTSLEVDTLPIETYRSLATTDSIKNKIIKEVGLKDNQGELLSPSDIENMLTIETQSFAEQGQQGQQSSYQAPVITLKVTHKEPEKAAEIANSWSTHFMNDCRELRQGEVREVVTVIEEQFADTQDKLEKAKEKLKEYKEEVRLEILQSELIAQQERLDKLNNSIVTTKTELGIEKSKLEHLEQEISKRTIKDRKWSGELNTKNLKEQEVTNTARLNYLEAQQQLLDYKKEHDVNLLKINLTLNEDLLKEYMDKITNLKDTLEDKKSENEKIIDLLESEPDRWELKKAITSDAMWEKILNPEQINAIKNMQLSNEIINPIYRSLRNKKADNDIIIESYPQKIDHYEKQADEKTRLVKEQRNKLQEWNQTIDNLNKDINMYKNLYDQYAEQYRNLKISFEDTKINVNSLKAQLAFYNGNKNEITDEIKELQSKIWTAQNKKETLTKEVENLENTYEMLATRVEEARLTQAQKTGDVKFVAEAIPPTKPININTKLNIAIAFVHGLFLGVFVVFFKEFMKEEGK